MTDDRMALIELIEKGAGGDLMRELLALRPSAGWSWRWRPGREHRRAPAARTASPPEWLSGASVEDARRPD